MTDDITTGAYTCPRCERTFITSDARQKHINSVHHE